MKSDTEERVHVVIAKTAAAQLDQLVARAVIAGERPAGRRPGRGSMLEELVAAALAAQTPNAGESEGR